MEPLVSIIMPSYNSAKYIEDSIKSIQSQDYQNWELLITDDVSTDNTCNIVRKLMEEDKRIKLFVLDKNSGAAVARNNSIKEAKGDYIAFLDSDDLWEKNKLKDQISFMEECQYDFSYGGYKVLKGEEIIKTYMPEKMTTYKKMIRSNCIGTLTAIYNCKKLGKVYMPEIRKRQDYALWLKILREKNINAYSVNEVIGTYRHVEGSVSSNKLKLLKYQYRVFRQCEKMSVIRSIYYVCLNSFYRIFLKY